MHIVQSHYAAEAIFNYDNLKKKKFKLLPFANLDIGNLISQKLLQLGASNLDI